MTCTLHGLRKPLLAWVMALVVLALPGHARACSAVAQELVRQGKARVIAGDEDVALRRFTDALTLDAYCGEGYLALGDLRRALGHPDEAVVVYTQGLVRLPTLEEALAGRASAYLAMGQGERALDDMVRYAQSESPAHLMKLADFYGEQSHHLAQLATWRRIQARGVALGDRALMAKSTVMVHALQWLTAPADAVAFPASPSGFRRFVAQLSRK